MSDLSSLNLFREFRCGGVFIFLQGRDLHQRPLRVGPVHRLRVVSQSFLCESFRVSPQWEKQMAELELAKDCGASIRKGLKQLAERKRERAEQQRLLEEVASEFRTWGGWQ